MLNETSSTGDSRRGVLKRGAAMLGTLKLGSLIAGTASGYQDEKSPLQTKSKQTKTRFDGWLGRSGGPLFPIR